MRWINAGAAAFGGLVAVANAGQGNWTWVAIHTLLMAANLFFAIIDPNGEAPRQ